MRDPEIRGDERVQIVQGLLRAGPAESSSRPFDHSPLTRDRGGRVRCILCRRRRRAHRRPSRGGTHPAWRSALAAASDPASASRSCAARPPTGAGAAPRPPPRPTGLTDAELSARGGARGADGRRGAGGRDRRAAGRRSASDDPRGRRHAGSRPRGRTEYAYVARDLRTSSRIAILLLIVLFVLYIAIDVHRGVQDHADPARATIAPCPPGAPAGARPEPLFQPPPERQPLAARMRPRTLEEFVGQAHLVGERGPLRRSVTRGHLASLLLWGPPGTGKTSLARLLADAVGADFRPVSAVMSGVAEVRAAIAEAQERLALERPPHGPVHRRDPPLQQGAAGRAPAARRGRHDHADRRDDREPVLRGELGAPVAPARVAARAAHRRRRRRRSCAGRSRTRSAALAGAFGPAGGVALDQDAFDHLVDLAGGDARQALNVLEGAVALAEDEDHRAPRATVSPTLADVESAAQQRVLAYDRAGDGHYATVSAFIKSLRGNDPDAALYWLAAMVAAGEDPRFIVRRLIISASEDVGQRRSPGAAGRGRRGPGAGPHRAARRRSTPWPRRRPTSRPRPSRTGRVPRTGPRSPTSSSAARSRSPTPPERRRPADEAPRHRRRLQVTRTTSRATTSSSSTCPTSSPTAATTCPTDQGYERTIGERMAAREAARTEARSNGGRPRRNPVPGPQVDAMNAGSKITRLREENRKKLGETNKQDATSD